MVFVSLSEAFDNRSPHADTALGVEGRNNSITSRGRWRFKEVDSCFISRLAWSNFESTFDGCDGSGYGGSVIASLPVTIV